MTEKMALGQASLPRRAGLAGAWRGRTGPRRRTL